MASQKKGNMSLLIILMGGLFLAILNQTLLNVAMPHLMTEFNVSATTIQWLTTGYMLVNGVLIPLSAFLIMRFGGRSLFLTAMLLFTVGTLICGIAPNFSTMLTGRLIQAVGGGILQPLVMTTILFIFPPESRGKGMGIFGLAMMFAPAVGPTLSGWVIENYSWRIMFYGLVPVGLIVIIFGFFLFKNMTEPKKIKLDTAGAILSIVGFAALLYGVSEAGSDGWDDPLVLSTVVIGVIGIAAFIIQQLKSKEPMLDFRVFKYDMFSLSSVINAIITVALYAGMFLIPIYLQNLVGFTALQSGLLMLPGALVMLVMSPISGILFDKVPKAASDCRIIDHCCDDLRIYDAYDRYTVYAHRVDLCDSGVWDVHVDDADHDCRHEPASAAFKQPRNGDVEYASPNQRFDRNELDHDDLYKSHDIPLCINGRSDKYG